MATELTPLPDGGNQPDRNDGSDFAVKYHNQEQGGKGGRFNAQFWVIQFLTLAFGSGAFTVFGDYFDDVGLHGAKPWCNWLGMVCLQYALANGILKWLRLGWSKAVKAGFVLLIAIQAVILWIADLRKPDPAESKPRVKVVLNTLDFPQHLELTNSSLITDPISKLHPILGYLMVPVASPDSPVVLEFGIANDSQVSVDGLQVIVQFSKELQCWSSPSSGWAVASIGGSEGLDAFGIRDPQLLFPNSTTKLPPLFFKLPSGWQSRFDPSVMLGVVVTTKTGKTGVHFGLGGIPVATVSKPELYFPTFPTNRVWTPSER